MKKMLWITGILSLLLVGCDSTEVDSGVVEEVGCNNDNGSSFKSTITIDSNKKYYTSFNDCKLIEVGADIKVFYSSYNMRISTFEYSNKSDSPSVDEE